MPPPLTHTHLPASEPSTPPPAAAAVTLWVFGEQLSVSPVLAAMLGLCLLLLTGTLTWKDCLSYAPAWDTLTWFAGGVWGAMGTVGVSHADLIYRRGLSHAGDVGRRQCKEGREDEGSGVRG